MPASTFSRRCSALGARGARPHHHQRPLHGLRLGERLGQDAGEARRRRNSSPRCGAWTSSPPTPASTTRPLYQPHLGEHVAWGDTGTVIYANSVFGARSNFESGPRGAGGGADRAHAGIRLPSRRAPQGHVRGGTQARRWTTSPTGARSASWSASAPELLRGARLHTAIRRAPLADELKHLGGALASYGSMGMFHFVGVTPEAPSVEAAFGGQCRPCEKHGGRRRGDRGRSTASYELGDGDARLVVFSGPQHSLFEMKHLAALFEDRQVKRRHPRASSPPQRRDPRSRATSATRSRWKTPASRCWRACASTSCRTCRRCARRTAGRNMVSQLGQDREHHRRAPLQHHPAAHGGLRGDRLHRGR